MPSIRFQTTTQKFRLVNLNTRTEKHGDKRVPAADMKFSGFLSSDCLECFNPTLKDHLFDASAKRDLADGMPLAHPEIKGAIPIDGDVQGGEVHVYYGIGDPMKFTECKIDSFKVQPIEGGSVGIEFTVKCRPDKVQIGNLYELQQEEMDISVIPPPLPEVGESQSEGS